MKMKPHDKHAFLIMIDQFRKLVEQSETTTPCMDCQRFEQGYCKKWEQVIPDSAKQDGCSSFVFDEMSPPF